MRNEPPSWALPAILVVALGLRLLAWSQTTVMMSDGVDFLWQARNVLDGQLLDALAHPYHPLYGLAIAAVA